MAGFGDLFKGGRNRRNPNQENQYEYYEDTHNERGEYVGRSPQPQMQPQQKKSALNFEYSASPTMKESAAKPLPSVSEHVSARNYQNVVVYEPANADDVQMLIDYMKRREPAIVNLDNAEPDDAQRILDFVSGAIYALNGSVHRIASNIFLLSPEGVEITVPYEPV